MKICHKLERRMDGHNKNFTEELENTRKYQTEVTEMKNTIITLKNTLEDFNRRLDEAKEQISELEDKTMELIQTEQQKEKKKSFKK